MQPPDELTLRLNYLAGYADALRYSAPQMLDEAGLETEDLWAICERFKVEVDNCEEQRQGLRAKRALANST